MNQSESLSNLAPALVQAISEIKSVTMDSVNPFYKSKYASLGSNIETAKPALSKHGLSCPSFIVSDMGQVGLQQWLIHSSGEYINNTVYLPISESGRSTAQELGATISYLRRYALAALLMMYADEDTDAEQPRSGTEQREQITKELGYSENQPSSRAPLSPVKLKEKLVLTANTVKPATEKQLGYVARLMADAIKDPEELKEVKLWLTGTEHLQQADQRIVHAILKWFNVINYKIDPVALDELTAIRVHIQTADGQDTLL